MSWEFRVSYNVEQRVKANGKGIEGYAAVFGKRSVNLGGFRETIRQGAFARAIREKQDVRALFNHDSNLVLGRSVESQSLRLAEDSAGLQYEVDLNDTQVARDVLKHIERKDVTGCSFSFNIRDRKNGQEWSEGRDDDGSAIAMREIRDVDLNDVGPVTFPAYTATSVDARSLFPDMPVELRAIIVRASGKTKRVAGEDLSAGAFAYVGDPADSSSWKLPIKFSTDEKTKSHIRNAMSRFSQTKGIPAAEKSKVWDKIVAAAKSHGIDVSDDDNGRAARAAQSDECNCDCDECEDGNCMDCSDANCTDPNCDHDGSRALTRAINDEEMRERMRLRVELAKRQ